MTFALMAAVGLTACQGTPETGTDREGEPSAQAVAADVERALAEGADVVVYKSPTCGCCNGWIDHLRANGFEVEAVDVPRYADLQARKSGEGVPQDLGSCHTAVIDGYAVEGHVPADVIVRLLRERPEIRGIAVPGMPVGSPGMEGPDAQPYQVIAFTADGERHVFETVDPRE